MKKFISKNDEEIKEILYYYNEGIKMGKEEKLVTIINNLKNLKFDLKDISKITNTPIFKLKDYIE